MIDTKIFENLKANNQKLIEYGFIKSGEDYVYSKDICNGEFNVRFTITNKTNVIIDVFENETNEKLMLFYIKSAEGAFIGNINSACEEIATDIILKCFERSMFKNEQSKQVINYIQSTYGDELEFLWEKFSNNAIWRRKDNKKWYGILISLKADKLGFNSNETIEIIDLRVDKNNIENIINNENILPAYHMNKKSWITVCLNNKMDINEIYKLIDDSYILALKK